MKQKIKRPHHFIISYRTLCGQDQREKSVLDAIKHTFQANSALLTTKSALTVQ